MCVCVVWCGVETVEIGCRMCLFLSPCTAERRLVADGHVFSLTVCGLTRIYFRPVPVPVLFLLVLGFGRFASSARARACVCVWIFATEHLHLRCTLFTRPKDVQHCCALPEEFLRPLFFALLLSRGSQRACVCVCSPRKGMPYYQSIPPHVRRLPYSLGECLPEYTPSHQNQQWDRIKGACVPPGMAHRSRPRPPCTPSQSPARPVPAPVPQACASRRARPRGLKRRGKSGYWRLVERLPDGWGRTEAVGAGRTRKTGAASLPPVKPPRYPNVRIPLISPIFPSGYRRLSFAKGTNGKVCGLWNNGEDGVGEHGCLGAFFSRFSTTIPPRFSPFFCHL